MLEVRILRLEGEWTLESIKVQCQQPLKHTIDFPAWTDTKHLDSRYYFIDFHRFCSRKTKPSSSKLYKSPFAPAQYCRYILFNMTWRPLDAPSKTSFLDASSTLAGCSQWWRTSPPVRTLGKREVSDQFLMFLPRFHWKVKLLIISDYIIEIIRDQQIECRCDHAVYHMFPVGSSSRLYQPDVVILFFQCFISIRLPGKIWKVGNVNP